MELLPAAVAKALSELPDVRLDKIEYEREASGRRVDALIDLEIQGRSVRLLVENKKNAFPRDVRAVIGQLSSLLDQSGDASVVPMLVAPALPQSSRELLRAKHIAYADGGGSLYLPWSGGIFYVDRPAPRSAMREALNIFKGNAARVLHVLMSEPGRRWHLVELADQAKVSPSTVHQVLFVLQNHLWVDARGLGPKRVRVLREPGALLEAWREEYSLKQYDARSFYGWAKSAEELRAAVTSAIDAAGVKYALTLASGAALVAPYATSVQTLSIIILAGADMDPVWTKAALEPAEDGANVTVMISKSDAPLLLRREIDGVWVASDVQLYLDLWVSPSRGKEQAEHLRRERLKY